MATISSDDSYFIHIAEDETSDRGYKLLILNNASTPVEMLEVDGFGDMLIEGQIIVDALLTVQNEGSGELAHFRRGSGGSGVKAQVHSGGRLEFTGGDLVLFAGLGTPAGTADDGDIYWRETGGSYYFRAYVNTGWDEIAAINC